MSKVGIWNLALIPLGVDRVADPLEDTEQARKCNEIWDYIRDDEVSCHPWNFALTRVACAVTTDTVLYGYTYSYQIPSDCLRIIDIETDEDAFKREGDKILTDVSTLYIRYIKQVTDTNEFSPSFKTLMAARLKFELSTSLTGSKTMTEALYAVLQKERRRAKAADAQEGTPDQLFSDRIVKCRDGSIR